MAFDNDLDVVRAALERVSKLDMDGAIELTAEDYALEVPFRSDGGPTRLEGDKARSFMRFLPTVLARLDFYDVVVHGATPNGLIFAEYKSNGMTKEGRPYPNAYIAVFELVDHRITVWREYYNPVVIANAFPD